MKKCKRIMSVILTVVMLVAVLPVMNVSATQSRSDNFYSAEYNSDPGQYMVNIATAQLGRTGSSLGYTEEWCADFVSDCAKIAGQSDVIPANGLVSTFANNISGSPVSASDAMPGDIVIIDWDGNGNYNHVEIVYAVSGSSVYSIGGNTGVSDANLYTRKVAKHSPLSSSVITKIIRPNYKSQNVEASVSTNKKHYSPNETATWSFDAEGASSIHLYIYKDGNKFFEGQFSTSATYSRKMTDTGHYAFHIIAHYPGRDVNSAWNDCNVSDLAAYLPSGRNLFYTGETVDFKFAAPFASSVHLYIYKDGAKFFEGQFSTSATYSRTISATGHYTFTIVAHYPTGNENGVQGAFDVVLPNVKTDKQIYQIGETAKFTFNAKGATSLHLYIYKDGNHWFEGQFSEQSTYSRCFDSAVNYAGDYYCYIIAHYDSGNYQSENYSFTVVSNHTHSYTSSVTRPATCSALGVKTFTCSCGDSYTEPIPINANNHVNTTNVAATASTCTVKGYTAGVYCNDCKKYVSGHQEQVLNTNNHVNTKTVTATASTCTVKGYSAGVYCNDCKKYISGHQEQPLAAHQTTVINARAATYDAEGYTGDDYCTVCKQTIHTGTIIPKLTRPNDPTPQPQSGGCKWCGGNHGGAFGWITRIFHNILAAIFGAKY